MGSPPFPGIFGWRVAQPQATIEAGNLEGLDWI